VGLQYCVSRKVRSSKHSGVQYWYSKCTPIGNTREFYVKKDENDLQELMRYLDSQKFASAINNTEDEILERDFETSDSDGAPEVSCCRILFS